MPRHIKSRAQVGPKAVRHGRPKKDGWRTVQRVSVQTAELIQIGPDHDIWTSEMVESWASIKCRARSGSIVKLVPAPGTAESRVLAVERSFYDAGAKSVKVMPTQEEVVVTIDDMEFKRPDMTDTRSLRQVALDRVDRATNAYDQDALRALVNAAMDHAEA